MSRSIWSRCLSTARRFDHISPAAKDPITSVTEAFLTDPNPDKINLGVVFRESVSAAINSKLVEESCKLIYGGDSESIKEERFAGIQALSGTGACRLFAEFQRRFYPDSHIYFPNPTWSNHHNIWRDAQVSVRNFCYYRPKSKGLNFEGLISDIKNAPDGSFFLFHPCAHNPTGIDPTEEEWREISYHLKVKNHFPFFDVAYQGFASGDIDKDVMAIRIFLQDGHLVASAQSFAKNMGLYGHRVGCLSFLCDDVKQAFAIKSQLQKIARAMYGSPPVHGVLLVSTILGDQTIKALWTKELKIMADRIHGMRTILRESLEKLASPLNWEHITSQVGMFCYSGLKAEQIDRLARDFHVYMTSDGRISMAGVTTSNVDYLATAIHEVTKSDFRES
ncbi:hypothetical protein SAY87_009206 [Trapa incisa]|uniref:Aspartate aminotransferase n=1 Tax=Trapa incisa TaxID=236973 RepID=A0AAN7PXC1_9MYRT|nr:hypothetical protein SAY87_009206 [Trapa incisa]